MLQKEIALQLVYNNIQEGRVDKSSTVKVINSFSNAPTLSSWFVEYSDPNIEEIKAKEVELTGGASYLDWFFNVVLISYVILVRHCLCGYQVVIASSHCCVDR
nr:hypothetical protein [Candidatus Rickettsia colombianensi]